MPRLEPYRDFISVIAVLGCVRSIFTVAKEEVNSPIFLFLGVSFFILASTLNNTFLFILNMLNLRSEMAIRSIISILVGIGFGSGMLFWQPTASFWLLRQSIGLFWGIIGAKSALLRHTKPSNSVINKRSLLNKRTLLSYCLPVAIANGFMLLQLNGYRFEIEYYWGMDRLGYLAIGVQVATQISFLAESLATQFLYPMFYRRCQYHKKVNDITSAVSDLMNTLAPVYFILIGAIIAGAPFLLRISVSTNYREACVYLEVGAIIELH